MKAKQYAKGIVSLLTHFIREIMLQIVSHVSLDWTGGCKCTQHFQLNTRIDIKKIGHCYFQLLYELNAVTISINIP